MAYDIITVGDGTSDIFLNPHMASIIPRQQCLPKKSCQTDMLCFNYGEKITVDEVYYDVGGSACNVAVGLSVLGFNTAMVSVLGEDLAGEKVLQRLNKKNVSNRYIKILKDIATSFSVIVNFRGERTIFVYHGLDDYSKLKIPQKKVSTWLYLGPLGKNYQNVYKQVIALASEKNVSVALNPGGIQLKENNSCLKGLIKVSQIIFLNREEAQQLISNPQPQEIKTLLKIIHSYGCKNVVITDGHNGAYATNGKVFYHIPSMRAEVVDSTGAGDAFSSGFLASYINSADLEQSLTWGIINSTVVIEKIGAQTNLLNKKQIAKMAKFAEKLYKL